MGIWWPEDLVYYYGQLTDYNAEAGTHAVLYDMDGITEHVTLTEHKVEWVAPGEARAGAGAPEASGHSSGNAAGGKDAKRLKAEQQILEGLKMAGADVKWMSKDLHMPKDLKGSIACTEPVGSEGSVGARARL